MPYAQHGFPFAEGSEYRQADFIAEGLDQTRGWFYTLLVLGTALFDECPYKNVIVNGIVLAEDGEKMSKRKNNYPPVDEILSQFGADALRLYLINTPVVRAGDIKFTPSDIREVARRYSMMLKNATKFFSEMVGLYLQATSTDKYTIPTISQLRGRGNIEVMDEWIMECLNELLSSVTDLMNKYQLNGIVEKFYRFIDQLSRWYMNMNKKRYKRCDNTVPLDVLGLCLYHFSLISAPFAPFITESVYQHLRKYECPNHQLDSIHYHQIPSEDVWNSNGDLLELFDYVSDIVDVVRVIRNKRANTSAKMPLLRITLLHREQSVLDTLKRIEPHLRSQLNIEQVEYSTEVNGLVQYDLQPDIPKLKLRIQGREVGDAIRYVKQLTPAQKQQFGSTRTVPDDSPIRIEELKIIKSPNPGVKVETTNRITVEYDDSITRELTEKFTVNQFHRQYQQARKDAYLVQTDRVVLEYSCTPELNEILVKHHAPDKHSAVYMPQGIDPDHYSDFLLCAKPSLELGEITILLRK
jgi:isoleucyl-tRNA synthetase